ncbi:porin family protein [Hymenobacter sp. BT491]|uniref:porin family protein n=1 Tax=Hymenobacter sp. BT491 TaxID=2766779 RepID=UPI0016536D0E|nr:porin family protein [Hymenobacter sp. BT491]MBC6991553.1 PorT family protein [Hymenobacter sp. BT491]
MKRILLLLLSLVLVSSAHAQFGIKGGINKAVLDGSNVNASTHYMTSYHAGLLYEFKVVGPVSIQPELLYSSQGTSFKSEFENFDAKLHYFSVPVLAKVYIGPVFVEAGPQVGFLLDADKNGTQQTGEGTFENIKRRATNDFKRGDFGVAAGAGLRLSLFTVGARFNAGLNDINDLRNLSGLNDPQLKNRVFQLYGSIQLGGRD